MARRRKPPIGEAETVAAHRSTMGDIVVVEETMIAGRKRARVMNHSLVDRLFYAGRLGMSRDASPRHDAAVWLRGLYDAIPGSGPSIASVYDPQPRGDEEMTDRQALDYRLFVDTALHMGKHWAPLSNAVCCDRPVADDSLCVALDYLRKIRGMP